MAKFLYIFAYPSPEQVRIAASGQPTEESSEALFITANSAEEAQAWGREVSEAFLNILFPDKGLSWKSMGFDNWVEADPKSEYPEDALAILPVVSCGSYPDFSPWLARSKA